MPEEMRNLVGAGLTTLVGYKSAGPVSGVKILRLAELILAETNS